MNNNRIYFLLFLVSLFIYADCSKNNGTPKNIAVNQIDYWLTKADETALLQKQLPLSFSNPLNSSSTIEIDSTQTYQTIDGFGFTLTGGSAYLINKMDAASQTTLLTELFGNGNNSIGISYLRVSIGASDLSSSVFSYDDLPSGQTDINLTNFSLSQDVNDLIPVLKKIIAINPNIKILGSPWSAPVWMKDNSSSIGGSLLPQYYNSYAQYFVKYIQAMAANGITVDAVTIQNEPQNGGNNPSMILSAAQEADFVKSSLGPAFAVASIKTKIIVWDHNCDNPTYPITILNDAAANAFIDGSAFHLYAGDISALSTVHSTFPGKNVYFTEQWTGATGTFAGDFQWHEKNVIIGSMLNWSKIALEWNLANDPFYSPHTSGGCTECKGALTIDGSNANRNVGYYIIAQVSKFIPAGSVRISSSTISNVSNVAFQTPQGKKVLLVLNQNSSATDFNIKFKNNWAAATLPANSAATYIW